MVGKTIYVVYNDYEILFKGLIAFALVELSQKSNVVGVEKLIVCMIFSHMLILNPGYVALTFLA